MKIKNYLIFILFILILSCRKDKPIPQTPSISKEPYQMRAKINGADWIACNPGLFGPDYEVGVQYFVGYYLDIDGLNICNNTSNVGIDIYIKIMNYKGLGTYNLGGKSTSLGKVWYGQKSVGFKTDTNHIGLITITDTLWGTLSGNFSFDGFNVDSNKVIKVTNGILSKVHY